MINRIEWLNEKVKEELAYDYWNDVEKEKNKPYAISDENIEELLKYLKDLGVYQQIEELITSIVSNEEKSVSLISLGSGICWELLIYSLIDKINRVDFVDFSKHRIHEIAPKIYEMRDSLNEKEVNLIHGSYYELSVEDESYDCITMCEALMMADNPNRLLEEASRVLKKRGAMIICGEPKIKISIKGILYYIYIKMRRKKMACDVSGAHSYYLYEYKKMFKNNGLKIKRILRKNKRFWGFYLIKE